MELRKDALDKLKTDLQKSILETENVVRKLPLDQIHQLAEKVLPYTIGGDTDSIDLLIGPVVSKYCGIDDNLLKQLISAINFSRYYGREDEAQVLEADLKKLADVQEEFTTYLLELLHQVLDRFWSQFGVKQSTIRFSQDPPAISQLIIAKKIYVLHNFGGELTAKNIGEKRTDPEYTKKILPKLVYLSMGLLFDYKNEETFTKELLKNVLPLAMEAYQLLSEFDFQVSTSQSISPLHKYKTLTQAAKALVAYKSVQFLASKAGINLPEAEYYERGALFFTKPSPNLLKYTNFWKRLLPKPMDTRPIIGAAIVYTLANETSEHNCPDDPNAYLDRTTRFSCLKSIFKLFNAKPVNTDDALIDLFFSQFFLPSTFDKTKQDWLDTIRTFVEIDYIKSFERILTNYLTILLDVTISPFILLQGVRYFIKKPLNDDTFDVWYNQVRHALTNKRFK